MKKNSKLIATALLLAPSIAFSIDNRNECKKIKELLLKTHVVDKNNLEMLNTNCHNVKGKVNYSNFKKLVANDHHNRLWTTDEQKQLFKDWQHNQSLAHTYPNDLRLTTSEENAFCRFFEAHFHLQHKTTTNTATCIQDPFLCILSRLNLNHILLARLIEESRILDDSCF